MRVWGKTIQVDWNEVNMNPTADSKSHIVPYCCSFTWRDGFGCGSYGCQHRHLFPGLFIGLQHCEQFWRLWGGQVLPLTDFSYTLYEVWWWVSQRLSRLFSISLRIRDSRATLIGESRVLFWATRSTTFWGSSSFKYRQNTEDLDRKTKMKLNTVWGQLLCVHLVHKKGGDGTRVGLIVQPEQFSSVRLSLCARPALVPLLSLSTAPRLGAIWKMAPQMHTEEPRWKQFSDWGWVKGQSHSRRHRGWYTWRSGRRGRLGVVAFLLRCSSLACFTSLS